MGMIVKIPGCVYTAIALWFAGPACAEYSITHPSDSYSIGIEGFRETYTEPVANLSDTANYGSITGNWTHYFVNASGRQFFAGLDGRLSYSPRDHYQSDSGYSSGDGQTELDVRLLAGMRFTNADLESLSPYIGAGVRYYRDDGKGIVTDTGASGYDRRITQVYLPIGVTYNYKTAEGWSLTPTLEGDVLINGTVETRLQNIGGSDVENTQGFGTGYGLRADFMAGLENNGFTWQAGPFVRYWHVNNSDMTCDDINGCGYEPKNTRTQYGAEVKLLW